MQNKKIYLDWASSAPVSLSVQKAVQEYLINDVGNPSSVHSFGRYQRAIIDNAKTKIAEWLKVEPREVYFTSGATESLNWVIKRFAEHKDAVIISSPVEHKAVLVALKHAQKIGARVELLNVDKWGRIDINHLEQLLIKYPKALVSFLMVNNETGNIENVQKIGTLINKNFFEAIFHIDATQALGWLDCGIDKLNYHYLTGTAHKLGGLKGSGLLIMKKGFELEGLVNGGGQEFDLRGGTENTLGILSWLLVAKDFTDFEKEHVNELRNQILEALKTVKNIHCNTDLIDSTKHILNIAIDGIDGEALMMSLDLRGVAISTGSACTTGATSASHVLLASGLSENLAKGSIRISFGPTTKNDEIKIFVKILIEEIKRLRKVSGYGI